MDLLDRLIRSSVDGILAFDRECRYTVWNPAMERISGIGADQTVGRLAFDIFPFLEEIGEDRFFHAALAGESVVARDRPFTIPGTGKQGFFEGHYSPLLDERENVIGGLGIIREITERKRLEVELLRSQKLESVGRLAGGIAHDFNNLLTVILGAVGTVRSSLPGDSELQESLDLILSTARRGARLTSQLLAFARQQVVQPRVLDLNELVNDVQEMLRRLIGDDVEFHTRLEPRLWRVKADVSQMEQLLVNLAINAREAMPSGGELHLETENVEVTTDEQHGDYVRLVVRDTGQGMDEQTRRYAFEPFFSTKQGSRGLGLASCYGIVKQAGGNLSVETEIGRGTSFTIDLPRTLEPVPTRPARETRPQCGGAETILVVEDQPDVRKLLVAGLEASGHRVLEAADGEAALQTALAFHAPIDVLVTDAVMPRMGGLELIARLRELRPGIKSLLISGHSDAIRPDSVETPAAFLQKPFAPDELVRRVRELLEE